MIKVSVYVLNKIYADAIASFIKTDKEIEVVDKIYNSSDIINSIFKYRPDVILLDVSLPKLNILDLLRSKRISAENIKILLLLKDQNTEEELTDYICMGVNGCIEVNHNLDHLIDAIKTVYGDVLWAERKILSKAIRKFLNSNKNKIADNKDILTNRENEIVVLIMEGYSNKQVAKSLYISEKTVKTHLSHIFKKLGIKCRFQLISNN